MRVLSVSYCATVKVVKFANARPKHIVNLVGILFTFEIRKKQVSKNFFLHKAFLILHLVVELPAKVVQNSIVDVQPYNLLDHFHLFGFDRTTF